MLQETLEWWLGIINDMEIPVEEAAVHSSHKAACTCSEYIRLEAASSDYWRTTPGLTRRIDSLSQQFAYNTVNAVTTQVGMQNGGVWIQWVDKGDSKVCTICRGYATGGPKGNGFYPLTEAPIEQPHIGCRCERRVYFYDPFGD